MASLELEADTASPKGPNMANMGFHNNFLQILSCRVLLLNLLDMQDILSALEIDWIMAGDFDIWEFGSRVGSTVFVGSECTSNIFLSCSADSIDSFSTLMQSHTSFSTIIVGE